jgi:hypothetical protein
MKQLLFTLIAISTSFAFGQAMPKQSPAATDGQTVGLNELTIAYSRTSANRRVIFGDLESYGDVWRLNERTTTYS